MKNPRFNHVLQYFYVLCGTALLAFAVVCFVSPNNLVTGGGTGLALILHYLFSSVSVGTLLLFVSVPFVILGFFYFGKQYTIKTFFALFSTAFFIDFFRDFLHLKAITSNILLATIFGGIIMGVGVGLIIKGRSSTGSTSVLGEIIAMKTRFKTSEALLAMDISIMIGYIITYRDMDKALYSMLGVYFTTKMIDVIISGRPTRKIVHIISRDPHALAQEVRERIEEHGTILTGTGLHHQQQTRSVLLLCVDASRLQLLKDTIEQFDPEAFLIVSEASEFFGWDKKPRHTSISC